MGRGGSEWTIMEERRCHFNDKMEGSKWGFDIKRSDFLIFSKENEEII